MQPDNELATRVTQLKTTYDNYTYSLELIKVKRLINKLGGELNTSSFKQAGKLYPASALSVLAISRDQKHGFKPDELLEKMLTDWLKKSISDYKQYAFDLFKALEELDCMDGVYLRLNLDSVAQPQQNTITIQRSAGNVSFNKTPKRDVFTGEIRRKIKQFLSDSGKFTDSLDQIYSNLKRIYYQYDLEMSLLAWMGYLILRASAGGSQQSGLPTQLMQISGPTADRSTSDAEFRGLPG